MRKWTPPLPPLGSRGHHVPTDTRADKGEEKAKGSPKFVLDSVVYVANIHLRMSKIKGGCDK